MFKPIGTRRCGCQLLLLLLLIATDFGHPERLRCRTGRLVGAPDLTKFRITNNIVGLRVPWKFTPGDRSLKRSVTPTLSPAAWPR